MNAATEGVPIRATLDRRHYSEAPADVLRALSQLSPHCVDYLRTLNSAPFPLTNRFSSEYRQDVMEKSDLAFSMAVRPCDFDDEELDLQLPDWDAVR